MSVEGVGIEGVEGVSVEGVGVEGIEGVSVEGVSVEDVSVEGVEGMVIVSLEGVYRGYGCSGSRWNGYRGCGFRGSTTKWV